ncbi:MAG: AsmA-like C-terminal region-containing protein [Chthoniobacteraceae bacterium]
MKRRIAKYLTIAAIVLVLLIAAGGWFLDRWLQSAEAHAKIEGKLSEALKMPVKIGALGFSSWSGLSVKKITVAGPDGILFEADGISASHSFSSLFRGSMGLSEVRISQPHIRLFQDAAGNWGPSHTAAPPQPVAALASLGNPVAAAPPSAPSAAQPTPPGNLPANPPPDVVQNAEKHRAVSIGKILIENGTVEMISKSHAPFATVTGLNVTMRDVTETAFTGSVEITRAILHGVIALDHLKGATTRDGQTFSLRNLSAETGGGGITGEGTYTIGATAGAAMKISAVNLARATLDGGMTGQKISGTVSGDAQFAGLGADKNAVTGRGTLALKSGDCSQFELLRQIGDIVRVAALANFQIADATANFQVANGQITLSPMGVSTPPIGIVMSGPVTFGGVVNLSAQLYVPASLVASQPMLAGQFSPPDANNLQCVSFKITGDMKKPRQNLAEVLTGTKDHRQQNIIAAGSVLSTLLQKNNPKLLKKLQPALQMVRPAQAPQPAPAQP